MNKTILKSIGAILVGFIVVFVVSIGIDIILEKAGLMKIDSFEYNTWWVILIAILGRCTAFFIGAYLTATFAPGKPVQHIIILGLIGTVFAIISGVGMWNKAPHWFLIVLMVIPLPCVWLGAKLKRG